MIGLLIAAVVAGSSLVNAAKLRALIAESIRYQAAVNQFRATYDAWPGDMANASGYWSTAANGNGNALLESQLGPTSGEATNLESYGAWQHLSLAGLIAGNFTGTAGVTGSGSIIGVNLPPSAYSNIVTFWFTTTNLWSTYSVGFNKMSLGGVTSGVASGLDFKIKVQDAAAIDSKVDDGHPYLGRLMAWSNSGSAVPCATTYIDTASTAQKLGSSYAVSSAAGRCNLLFSLGESFRLQ